MSVWDKSYSRAWCDEADLTHIRLWSIAAAADAATLAVAVTDGVESTSSSSSLFVVRRELECFGVSAQAEGSGKPQS